MSKITEIQQSQITPLSSSQSAKKASGDLFQQTLAQVLNNSEANTGNNVLSSQEIQVLSELTPVFMPRIETAEQQLTGQTQDLLGLMDQYVQVLENPSKTLKDLLPLVDQMQKDAESLYDATNNTDLEDSELKDIALQTAVAANVEYFRFYRGDYV